MKKVIKFYTPSCGPCRTYTPIFDKVKSETQGVIFEEVNCNEDHDSARKYGVRGVPTTIFLKDDEVVNRNTGLIHEDELKSMISKM